MSSGHDVQPGDQTDLLKQILSTVKSIKEDYRQLSAAVEAIEGQVSSLAGIKQGQNGEGDQSPPVRPVVDHQVPHSGRTSIDEPNPTRAPDLENHKEALVLRRRGSATSRIILTTYPGQSGIDPLPMDWGNSDHQKRGPVVVSRSQSTIRRRNGKFPVLLRDASNSL